MGDTVADAEALRDDRAEVGELFELLPLGWSIGTTHEALELGLQLLKDMGFRDHVEGDDGKDGCCCGGAGADDCLGFVLQVVVCFLL